MENHNERPPDSFEDQFRRMIVPNGTDASQGAVPQAQPAVRLPPTGPNHYPQQHQTQYQPMTHRQVATNGNVGPRVTVSSQSGNFPPNTMPGQPPPPTGYAPHQRMNQRQRRMHSQPHSGPALGSHGPPQGSYEPHRQHQYDHPPMDPNAFQRGGRVAGYYQQQAPPPRRLFNPNVRGPPPNMQTDYHAKQAQYLEQVVASQLPMIEMSQAERDEKEAFRATLQSVIREVRATAPDRLPQVSLECFGSFQSGFASAGSDMDLVIVLPDGTPYTACFSLLEDDLPRVLEKRLLQLGYGARLLTRTRVPIIKICEKPDACLLDKLREEREKWDALPNETKYPHLHQDGDDETAIEEGTETAKGAEPEPNEAGPTAEPVADGEGTTADGKPVQRRKPRKKPTTQSSDEPAELDSTKNEPRIEGVDELPMKKPVHAPKPWTRERKAGPLDFPKTGIGIQCDINFFNPLGLHNTQMLRCYSLCDPRVRPMVLFVKAWAKRRKINSSYSGTLSSYGYVLMVLHYLMNVAQPPILTNLQMPWRPSQHCTPQGATRTEVDGWVVDFWRNENEITQAVQSGQMSSNREALGSLLAGFFHYYSSQGSGPSYHWMREVLSLRSPGGLLTKEEKGWVKAITEEGEGKKVQHRYLFCIEDPFELSHNVARTVTHMGIVAIRDEFRRANRILHAQGYGQTTREGDLFADVIETEDIVKATAALKLDGAAENQPGNHTNAISTPNSAQVESQRRFTQNRNIPAANGQRQNGQRHAAQPVAKKLDMGDKDAFPALGAAKPKPAKGGNKRIMDVPSADSSEISGERAKQYLEELKRKKVEAHAELTATGAAEAVLGDD